MNKYEPGVLHTVLLGDISDHPRYIDEMEVSVSRGIMSRHFDNSIMRVRGICAKKHTLFLSEKYK